MLLPLTRVAARWQDYLLLLAVSLLYVSSSHWRCRTGPSSGSLLGVGLGVGVGVTGAGLEFAGLDFLSLLNRDFKNLTSLLAILR